MANVIDFSGEIKTEDKELVGNPCRNRFEHFEETIEFFNMVRETTMVALLYFDIMPKC